MNYIIQAVWQGLVLGLLLCISIGPGFFALLRTSLNYGFRSGIAFAFGVFLSDTACVFLAYLGASQLIVKDSNKFIVGVIGGTILLVFGVYYIFQKKSIEEKEDTKEELEEIDQSISISAGKKSSSKKVNYSLDMAKGFILNMINPFVLLLWISWVTIVSSNTNYGHIHIIIFFSVTLLTVLSTDVLKAFGAHKIKQMLNAHLLLMINRLVGLIMIGCGIWMMYRVF